MHKFTQRRIVLQLTVYEINLSADIVDFLRVVAHENAIDGESFAIHSVFDDKDDECFWHLEIIGFFLEMLHLYRSPVIIGSTKQIGRIGILNFDIVEIVLRIRSQNVESHGMPKWIVYLLLHLDLRYSEIGHIQNDPQNVCRYLWFVFEEYLRQNI